MKNHKSIPLALALALASCASVTGQAESPALNATVVEIPSDEGQPSQHLLTGTYTCKAGEAVHFPKCITLEGTRASMFVGTVGPHGEETGFQVEFIVEDAVATVSACELRDGEIVAQEEQSIPVERP
jgi:hypothetical protein